jgi:glucokinase
VTDWHYLALDIGGTKIEAGLVSGRGEVLDVHRVPAHAHCGRSEFLDDAHAALKPFVELTTAGMGVGFPGLLDPTTGVIAKPSRSVFPSLESSNLRDVLEERFDIPVKLDNDANMCALGIHCFGEGREYSNLAALTLGTNLGVGIVQGERLKHGPNAMPEDAQSLLDRWPGWYRHNGAHLETLYGADGATLSKRARNGDDEALDAFAAIGTALSQTVIKLLKIYSLEAIILAGGIAQSYDLFAPALTRGLRDIDVIIRQTALSHPALVGAAAMFNQPQARDI